MRRFAFLGVAIVTGIVLGAPAEPVAGQQPPAAEKPPQAAADKKAPDQKAGEKPAQAPEKDAAAPAAEAAREVPPERQALNEANKISDPDKKIEALKKVVEDFPKTAVVESANYAIFTTLVTKMKDAGKKALEQAKLLAEAGSDTSRGSQYTRLAGTLLAQDLLLQDAEAFALKGIEALDEKTFVEARKKSLAESAADALKRDPKAKPMQAPDDAQLAKMFASSKQNAYSTLGQIYAKLGKHAEAEKALRETYAIDPKAGAAATAAARLADYAKKAGREAEQLEYLTVVALAGRLTAESKVDFEAVYRKMHEGSLDGLEEMLDARYEREHPMPVHVKPYVRPAGRTGRVVLAEIFTGAGCPPCVAADLAFEAVLERYQPGDVAVLMYHLHIPRPDPMTNPSTQARQKLYGIGGVPSSYIDGVSDGRGGGDSDSAVRIYAERVEPAIEKRLIATADATIRLSAVQTPAGIQVKADVSGVKSTAKNLKLQLVLVEERVRYSGENGVRFHPMVVRSVAGNGEVHGFALPPGRSLKVEHLFDIDEVTAAARDHLDDFEKTSTRFPNYKFLEKKHGVDAAKLSIVAFVQDEDTKAILQAAQARPARAGRAN
jgi:hypothetical protein